MPGSGLFWRIFGAALALILLTAALSTWIASNRLAADVQDATIGILEDEVVLLEPLLEPALRGEPDPGLRGRVRDLGQRIGSRITVIRADGVVIADSARDPDAMDDHGSRPEIVASREAPFGHAVRLSDTLETRMVYVARSVRVDGAIVGQVRAAQPLLRLAERLAILRGTMVGAVVIAVAIALLGALLVAQRLAQPLRVMTGAAADIAAGDYDKRVRVSTHDEIGALGRAFNEMAARLAADVDTIRRDRRELRAILGAMAEGVIAVDDEERVVLMNDAAAAILDVSPAEAGGRPLWGLLRRPQVPGVLADAMRLDEARTAEFTVIVRERERTLRLHASPLRGGAEAEAPRGAVLVLEDVTERQRLDAMRRDFIANASHELKTPVASIRAIVETVLDDTAMDADTRRGFLERVQRQADRLGSLLEEMLALSRLEARRLPAEGERTDLRVALREALDGAAPLAADRGIRVDADLGAEEALVRADPEALRRIGGNLLDNAIKYGRRGGRVAVRVRTTEDHVILEVEDDGPGIPAEKRERIFERFYRMDSGRSRDAGGTGLGLAIVKHLVQALDGRIEVQGAPGQGSTFRVRLPRA